MENRESYCTAADDDKEGHYKFITDVLHPEIGESIDFTVIVYKENEKHIDVYDVSAGGVVGAFLQVLPREPWLSSHVVCCNRYDSDYSPPPFVSWFMSNIGDHDSSMNVYVVPYERRQEEIGFVAVFSIDIHGTANITHHEMRYVEASQTVAVFT